jgi:hypothetical protein
LARSSRHDQLHAAGKKLFTQDSVCGLHAHEPRLAVSLPRTIRPTFKQARAVNLAKVDNVTSAISHHKLGNDSTIFSFFETCTEEAHVQQKMALIEKMKWIQAETVALEKLHQQIQTDPAEKADLVARMQQLKRATTQIKEDTAIFKSQVGPSKVCAGPFTPAVFAA